MTTLLLVRHAAHDWLGRGIPGRLPGVGLNATGRSQADQLVQRLHGRALAAIASSPQQRARETAAPLAAARRIPVEIDPAFDEIDFGEWTGRSFEQVATDGERWRLWCERKSIAVAPGGERFTAVQRRALAGVAAWRLAYPDGCVAVFSHGDVIKAVVAAFLSIPLDDVERFEIAPASVSSVELGRDWSRVQLVNGEGSLAGAGVTRS